jgi:SnoaL-like domain
MRLNVDDVYRLLAIEQIKQVRARYFRYVDTKNWRGLRELFCENATLHFEDSQKGLQRLDEAMDFVRTALADAVSIHHGHMPEIDLESEDRAHGTWAMNDELYWPENSRNPFGILSSRGAGYYHETYRRSDGVWRIASLRLTRLRRMIELLPQRSEQV